MNIKSIKSGYTLPYLWIASFRLTPQEYNGKLCWVAWVPRDVFCLKRFGVGHWKEHTDHMIYKDLDNTIIEFRKSGTNIVEGKRRLSKKMRISFKRHVIKYLVIFRKTMFSRRSAIEAYKWALCSNITSRPSQLLLFDLDVQVLAAISVK